MSAMWINIVAQLEEARDRRLNKKKHYLEQLQQGQDIEEAAHYFRQYNCCPYRQEDFSRSLLPSSYCSLKEEKCGTTVSECSKYKKRRETGFEDLEQM